MKRPPITLGIFPSVKRNTEEKCGEYRTRLLILDIYDRMKNAIDTGGSRQIILDPPLVDLGVAHSRRRADAYEQKEAVPG